MKVGVCKHPSCPLIAFGALVLIEAEKPAPPWASQATELCHCSGEQPCSGKIMIMRMQSELLDKYSGQDGLVC